MSTGSKIAIGCAVAAVLGCVLSCVGFMLWASVGNQGGVRYANNPEQYALDYIAAHNLLEPGERMVAYYDGTVSLDATELAILTDRRVIYAVGGVPTAIALSDIRDVTAVDEGPIGTAINVYGSGSIISIEVAPMNGAEGFHTAIVNAWHGAAPSVAAADAGASTPDAGADATIAP
jgi:hypothetical protein